MKGIAIDFLKTVDIRNTQDLFAKFAADPERDPIIVTRNGRPVAVVLPAQGADVETLSVSLSPKFNAVMKQSMKRHDQEGGISHEQVCREFGVNPKTNSRAPSQRQRSTSVARAFKGKK